MSDCLDRLTRRQRQVATLLADGLSDREIADRLFIGLRTAEWHVEQILMRLDARSRSEVAAHVARSLAHASPTDARQGLPDNLPLELTTFVGREAEVDRLVELLASRRLLTLTGAAGIGKTRLALRLAANLRARFDDGVYFVNLAAITEDEAVTRSVAEALNVRDRHGSSLDTSVVRYLSARQALLLLDNCEHAIRPVASLADLLLHTAPHLTVLVTSREPLRVDGETRWPVRPLELPTPSDAADLARLRSNPAIALFCDRATRVAPDFDVTDANAPAVVELCRRLEGVPLALELAAARASFLSPGETLVQLGRSDTQPVASSVQDSMQSAVQWSYDLLGEAEQILFRRLGVFAGGFTLASAEAVCAGEDKEPLAVQRALAALVDKSLVVVQEQGRPTKYRLLDVIGRYARAQLERNGELSMYNRRHCLHFLDMAQQEAPALFRLPLAALARMDVEQPDFRHALRWAVNSQPELALRLAVALWPYWNIRSRLVEGRAALNEVLRTAAGPAVLRCEALARAAQFAWYSGDDHSATSHAGEAVALGRMGEPSVGLAMALFVLGACAVKRGDWTAAGLLLEESLTTARGTGLRYPGLAAMCGRYVLAMQTGDRAKGRSLAAELLAEYPEAEHPFQHCMAQTTIAVEEVASGGVQAAAIAAEVGIRLAKRYGFLYWGGVAVRVGAYLAAAKDRFEECWRLVGASQMLRDGIPFSPWAPDPRSEQLLEAAARSMLPETRLRLLAEGEGLTPDQAFDLATASLCESARADADGAPITRRSSSVG